MQCARCKSDKLSVVDSRADGDAIRRRRECLNCGFRFTTFERVEIAMPMVVKKDGRREAFDRTKIKTGILRACEKRPVSIESIDRMVDRIEVKIHELCLKELESRRIGDVIIEELRDVDKIAYVRFASVYREFSDISQFDDALQSLKSVKSTKKEKRRQSIEQPK